MIRYILFSTLIVVAILLEGCLNQYGTQINQLRRSDAQLNLYRSNAAWARLEARSERARRVLEQNAQDARCPQAVPPGVEAGVFFNRFIARERGQREARGGNGCQCVPMGTSCSANTCLCSEICPADERILSPRAQQVGPDIDNQFPFTNTSRFNQTIFRSRPMNGGYCNGFVEQRRRFSLLGDFRPNMITVPTMDIPSQTWKEYTKTQIRRLFQGETPRFIGIQNLEDFNRPGNEDLKQLYLELSGNREWTSMLGVMNLRINSPIDPERITNIILKFDTPTARHFDGNTEVDPSTNTPIPAQGTPEYHTYMQGQIRKIMRGEPALLPGYRNLRLLASNPAYAELIGNEIAREWDQASDLDYEFNSQTNDDLTRSSNPARIMSASEINNVWNKITENLPEYRDRSYPKDSSGNGWNQDGPIGTLNLNLWGATRNESGSVLRKEYHAIEAYAYHTLEDGTRRICVIDPNTSNNNYCTSHIDIPTDRPPEYNEMQNWGTGFQLGTFDVTSSSRGRLGAMITQNINYCRQINAERFAANDCRE